LKWRHWIVVEEYSGVTFPCSPARQWLKMRWIDIYTRANHAISTGRLSAESVCVKTYEEIIDEYRDHPEPKSAGSDGKPCGRATIGLLSRLHVRVGSLHYIGKESNRIEDVQLGLVHELDEVVTDYKNPSLPPTVLEALRRMTKTEIAKATGLSERQVQRIRNGKAAPNDRARRVLLDLAKSK
jgi:hypothetical protein